MRKYKDSYHFLSPPRSAGGRHGDHPGSHLQTGQSSGIQAGGVVSPLSWFNCLNMSNVLLVPDFLVEPSFSQSTTSETLDVWSSLIWTNLSLRSDIFSLHLILFIYLYLHHVVAGLQLWTRTNSLTLGSRCFGLSCFLLAWSWSTTSYCWFWPHGGLTESRRGNISIHCMCSQTSLLTTQKTERGWQTAGCYSLWSVKTTLRKSVSVVYIIILEK